MRRFVISGIVIILGIGMVTAIMFSKGIFSRQNKEEIRENLSVSMEETVINLPEPAKKGQMSVEEAILSRRSVRSYNDEPLTLEEVSQILWSAQGITDAGRNFRAAPSAGALYPLEVYLVAGNVDGLAQGIYKYNSDTHQLISIEKGDKREELSNAALGQTMIKEAPVSIVFSAEYRRTTRRYGSRGETYVHIEIGHAGQNVYLQVAAMDLSTVAVGAFTDEQVKRIIRMPAEEEPLYIMPVGRKK